MTLPIGLDGSPDEMLRRAYSLYRDGPGGDFTALTAAKVELLRDYDVPGIENAVAICYWGRSGSLLLSSYLDGHEDVLMLALEMGQEIYHFLRDYPSLSVWEKLIAYPTYSEQRKGAYGDFFAGEFAIGRADYYAAIHGLYEIYGDQPSASLDTRKRFFQFLHVAYAVAIGARSANPRPMIVYSQHDRNQYKAQCFREDFPRGRFVHTVREPISSIDSQIDFLGRETRSYTSPYTGYILTPIEVLYGIFLWDEPHEGMAAITRAVRFEDMHLAPEELMRRLANWLEIPYRACLVDSTFNRIPYVVGGKNNPWRGANPENARLRRRNVHFGDRLIMFALLRGNYSAWNYPIPSLFRNKWASLAVFAAVLPVPTKMEALAAKEVMRLQILPSLRSGEIGAACRAFLRLFTVRWAIIRFLAGEARARLIKKKQALQPL